MMLSRWPSDHSGMDGHPASGRTCTPPQARIQMHAICRAQPPTVPAPRPPPPPPPRAAGPCRDGQGGAVVPVCQLDTVRGLLWCRTQQAGRAARRAPGGAVRPAGGGGPCHVAAPLASTSHTAPWHVDCLRLSPTRTAAEAHCTTRAAPLQTGAGRDPRQAALPGG